MFGRCLDDAGDHVWITFERSLGDVWVMLEQILKHISLIFIYTVLFQADSRGNVHVYDVWTKKAKRYRMLFWIWGVLYRVCFLHVDFLH